MEDHIDPIVANLVSLNNQIEKQNSLSRMFLAGIIYGIGFFVGSAVIATIAFSILGPWISKIPLFQKAFNNEIRVQQ